MSEAEIELTAEPSSEAEELETELERVARSTRGDGTIEAEIADVRPDDDHLVVEYLLPHGDTAEERMRRPRRETPEYKFVRLCEANGASIDTFTDLLIGSRVPVEQDDDGDWQVTVERDLTLGERVRENTGRLVKSADDSVGSFDRAGIFLVFCLLPVTVVFSLGIAATHGWSGVEVRFRHALIGILSGILWMGLLIGALGLL